MRRLDEIMPASVADCRAILGTLLPSAFENHFKVMAGDMAPQNRRAFKAIIKLLAEYVWGVYDVGHLADFLIQSARSIRQ